MHRLMSLLGCVACWSLTAGVPHHGTYADPNHYIGPSSFAGLRFIAEQKHRLMLVGTDDGIQWFYLTGYCSGPGMSKITFDFSSKGGPASLTGTAVQIGGVAQIVWPDGNAWTLISSPAFLPAAGALPATLPV